MIKKSKVTKLSAWNVDPDQYGNVPHDIEFENGDVGQYKGKPDKLSFDVGVDSEYEIIEKESKSGNTYNKITKPKQDNTQYGRGGVGFKGRHIPEGSLACSYAKKLGIAIIEASKSTNPSDVKTAFNESAKYIKPFKDWIIDNTSDKSAYLSYAVDVSVALYNKGLGLQSIDDIIKLANYYVKFD